MSRVLKSRLNCSIFEVLKKKKMPLSPKMHFRVYRYRNCGKAIINHYQTCLIYSDLSQITIVCTDVQWKKEEEDGLSVASHVLLEKIKDTKSKHRDQQQSSQMLVKDSVEFRTDLFDVASKLFRLVYWVNGIFSCTDIGNFSELQHLNWTS